MVEIFVFGCSCGINSRPVKYVQNKTTSKLYNTKRDSQALKKHIGYLSDAGIDIKHYPAIVVENGGERITLLEEWTQSH